MPRYARRAAKRAAIDASKAAEREVERFTPQRDDDDRAGGAVSPLATMVDAENRERLRAAAARHPGRQRDAVAFEIDPTRQSSEIEVKPTGVGHRSSLYKATNRLREWLSEDGAQHARRTAPGPDRAAVRRRAAPSNLPAMPLEPPSAPSAGLVAPSTTTEEGTSRVQEGPTEVADPSTTAVQPWTSPVEPLKATATSLTTSTDRWTARGDRATMVAPPPGARWRASVNANDARNFRLRVAG